MSSIDKAKKKSLAVKKPQDGKTAASAVKSAAAVNKNKSISATDSNKTDSDTKNTATPSSLIKGLPGKTAFRLIWNGAPASELLPIDSRIRRDEDALREAYLGDAKTLGIRRAHTAAADVGCLPLGCNLITDLFKGGPILEEQSPYSALHFPMRGVFKANEVRARADLVFSIEEFKNNFSVITMGLDTDLFRGLPLVAAGGSVLAGMHSWPYVDVPDRVVQDLVTHTLSPSALFAKWFSARYSLDIMIDSYVVKKSITWDSVIAPFVRGLPALQAQPGKQFINHARKFLGTAAFMHGVCWTDISSYEVYAAMSDLAIDQKKGLRLEDCEKFRAQLAQNRLRKVSPAEIRRAAYMHDACWDCKNVHTIAGYVIASRAYATGYFARGISRARDQKELLDARIGSILDNPDLTLAFTQLYQNHQKNPKSPSDFGYWGYNPSYLDHEIRKSFDSSANLRMTRFSAGFESLCNTIDCEKICNGYAIPVFESNQNFVTKLIDTASGQVLPSDVLSICISYCDFTANLAKICTFTHPRARALRSFRNTDLDLFLVTRSPDEAVSAIITLHSRLVARFPDAGAVKIMRTEHATTFILPTPYRKVQVIHRLYHSVEQVLLGFDIDCCALAYDGARVYTLPRGRRALETRQNIVDPTRQSTTYEARLFKYARRGFTVGVPGLKTPYLAFERALRPFALRSLVNISRLTGVSRLIAMLYHIKLSECHTPRCGNTESAMALGITGDWFDYGPRSGAGDGDTGRGYPPGVFPEYDPDGKTDNIILNAGFAERYRDVYKIRWSEKTPPPYAFGTKIQQVLFTNLYENTVRAETPSGDAKSEEDENTSRLRTVTLASTAPNAILFETKFPHGQGREAYKVAQGTMQKVATRGTVRRATRGATRRVSETSRPLFSGSFQPLTGSWYY